MILTPKSVAGLAISRAEALRIATSIMARTEREGIRFADQEAKLGLAIELEAKRLVAGPVRDRTWNSAWERDD